MVEELDRAENRLNNIRSVEPILSALRTISHASWQSARNRHAQADRYRVKMGSLLAQLIARFPDAALPARPSQDQGNAPRTLVAIGTERGLCGNFNREIVSLSLQVAQRWRMDGHQVQIWVVGSQLKRRLIAQDMHPDRDWNLSSSSLPPYELAWQMMLTSLAEIDTGDMPKLHVIYNSPQTGGRFDTTTRQLWPPSSFQSVDPSSEVAWPPPIIETDPLQMGVRILLAALASQFYVFLLKSAIAEHSTRFNLMEEASQNAERLMEELNDVVLSARRDAITQEMSELATASGLLERND